jgi:hypothetical protein
MTEDGEEPQLVKSSTRKERKEGKRSVNGFFILIRDLLGF